jgi:hypothetical protein
MEKYSPGMQVELWTSSDLQCLCKENEYDAVETLRNQLSNSIPSIMRDRLIISSHAVTQVECLHWNLLGAPLAQANYQGYPVLLYPMQLADRLDLALGIEPLPTLVQVLGFVQLSLPGPSPTEVYLVAEGGDASARLGPFLHHPQALDLLVLVRVFRAMILITQALTARFIWHCGLRASNILISSDTSQIKLAGVWKSKSELLAPPPEGIPNSQTSNCGWSRASVYSSAALVCEALSQWAAEDDITASDPTKVAQWLRSRLVCNSSKGTAI